MNYHNQTKEELILELTRLHQENDSIKELLSKSQDLKQVNEELTSSIEELFLIQERYSQLYNNTPTMLCSFDSDLYIISVSDFWLLKLEYSREEVIGKRFTEFLTKESRIIMEKNIPQEIKKHDFIQNIEIQFYKKSQIIIDTLLSATVEYDKNKKIVRYLSVLTDISDKKKAEKALKESEECYRTVVSSANDGIIYQERNGNIKTWNKKAEEIFDLKYEDVINHTSIKMNWQTYKENGLLFTPEEHPSLITLNTGKPCRDIIMKIVREDGNYSWINMNTNPVFKEGDSSAVAVIITFSDITVQKESEQSLKEWTLLNKQIIENIQEGIIVYNKELEYILWNPYMERLTGMFSSDILRKKPIEVFPFIEEIGIMNTLKNALNGGTTHEIETKFLIPSNGKTGWVSDTSSPLRNTKGEIIGVIATVRDITARKEVEEVLQQKNIELLTSNEKLEENKVYNRLLFDTSPIGLALCKMNGEIVDINQAYANIIGRTVEETLKLTYWDLTPKSYMAQEFTQISILKKTGKYGPYKKEYIHKDGHLVPVQLNGLIFHQNGEDFIWSTVEDISERIKTEDQLKTSEERYRLIAENSSDVIWVMNFDSKKITYISPSIYQLTGYKVEEMLGKSIYDIFTKESANHLLKDIEDNIPHISFHAKSKCTNVHEMQQKCKNNTYVWVEISTTLIKNKKEKYYEIIGVSRNIEERKKIENEVQLKNNELIELNNTKDKFFSIIAHDLKSPFSSILGLTEMLIDNIDSLNMEEIKELSQYINISADKTFRLLENLLEWSRLQRGVITPEFRDWNLKIIIDEINSLMLEVAKTKSITVNNFVSDDFSIYCDNEMLRTVIRNLISNAIKFTRNEGTIAMHAYQRDNHIEIQIVDNGIGIPKEIIPKLFKIEKNLSTPGTANEYGTGLGLLLCNDLIKKQGGTIWVESEVGKGTIFYFTIPNKVTTPTKSNTDKKLTEKETANIKNNKGQDNNYLVLVAEDEDMNYHLATKLLSGMSIKTIRANNGKEAIEMVEKNEDIDLILMDIRMPIIDGYEATRTIKRIKPEIPIIVQTAFAEEADQAKAFEAGCNDYMKKPLRKETLLLLMNKYLKIKS